MFKLKVLVKQNVNTRSENKIIVASLEWEQVSWWLAVTYWENTSTGFNMYCTLLASVKTHGAFWLAHFEPFCLIRHSSKWYSHEEGQQIVYY